LVGTITISKRTLNSLVKFVKEEIKKLQSELVAIDEELALLETKYGISSDDFLRMLQGEREWDLPEGSEPDIVEWEALLEQKKRLEKELKELRELWRQLQDYNRS